MLVSGGMGHLSIYVFYVRVCWSMTAWVTSLFMFSMLVSDGMGHLSVYVFYVGQGPLGSLSVMPTLLLGGDKRCNIRPFYTCLLDHFALAGLNAREGGGGREVRYYLINKNSFQRYSCIILSLLVCGIDICRIEGTPFYGHSNRLTYMYIQNEGHEVLGAYI